MFYALKSPRIVKRMIAETHFSGYELRFFQRHIQYSILVNYLNTTLCMVQ